MTNADHPQNLPADEEPRTAVAKVAQESEDHETSGMTILMVLALMTVAGIGLNYIASVFTPIFLALTLVLTVRPIGQWLMKRGAPSVVAGTVNVLVLVIVLFGMVGVTVLTLTPVPQTLMNYSINFDYTVQQLNQWLDQIGLENIDLANVFNQINFNSVVGLAWQLVDGLSSISGLLLIIGVAAFFITIDTTTMTARAKVINKRHANIGRAMANFERRVRSYWFVSAVFGAIVAVIDGFALQVMGIPLAWTWAYWAFITNFIPNIGFIIGVLPPMGMALLDQGWQAMVWVVVLYSVINVVIQTFIQPKLMGDVVGLSATVTFISLAVWTVIVGILGSLLAVPLTLFFKALLVDSDPRARWLDAYLISEQHIERKEQEGAYAMPKGIKPRGYRRKMHVARTKRAKN